jgi:hypothetical protein
VRRPALAPPANFSLLHNELRDLEAPGRRPLVEREPAAAAGADLVALSIVDRRPAERDAGEAAVERDGADPTPRVPVGDQAAHPERLRTVGHLRRGAAQQDLADLCRPLGQAVASTRDAWGCRAIYFRTRRSIVAALSVRPTPLSIEPSAEVTPGGLGRALEPVRAGS